MKAMRRLSAALFALSLVLVGCGGGDDADTGSTAGGGGADAPTDDVSQTGGGGGEEVAGTITIANFEYGDPLTVPPGALIRVVNEDSAEHDADAVDGAFDTELLGQGEELTFNAPEEEGTYELTCSEHPQMSGELIVAA